MSRLPYAARQLITQVEQLPELAGHEVKVQQGNPDGLGVVRTIHFDPATSRVLWPMMRDDLDPRVASAISNRGGLTLTFHPNSVVADDASPFELPVTPVEETEPEAVDEELESSEDESDGELPEP